MKHVQTNAFYNCAINIPTKRRQNTPFFFYDSNMGFFVDEKKKFNFLFRS